MQISSYMFQSPYSQPVQVGRPDPAMLREQMQEAQKAQKKKEEAVASMADNQKPDMKVQNLPFSSGFYQTSQGTQQIKQAVESFQAANRNTSIQAYVQNSMSS